MRHRHPRDVLETARRNAATCPVVVSLLPVRWLEKIRWWLERGRGGGWQRCTHDPRGHASPFRKICGGRGRTEPIVCGSERILVLESRG